MSQLDPDEIRRDRAGLSPAMDAAFQHAPELMSHFYQVMKLARLEGETPAADSASLGPKWRELITVAILTSLRSQEGLRLHINKAMDLGATAEEITETLQPCLVTLGAPAFLAGMGALADVLRQRNSAS